MKFLLSFLATLGFSASAWSQQTIAKFDWTNIPGGPQHGAVPVSLDGRAARKIECTNGTGLQLVLLTIDKPGISQTMYVLQGEIRYDSVQGDGFLEMLSYFPPEHAGLPDGQYFSRTLSEGGEMGKISGTSDWRSFKLPFDTMGSGMTPKRLKIALHLKGPGTVYLGPLTLAQYAGAEREAHGGLGHEWFFGRTAHPWWSNTTSIWVSNIAAVVLTFVGVLTGLLSWKGKYHRFVVGLLKTCVGLGAVCGVGGFAAFAQHQPFSVWFPLSLSALILIPICLGLSVAVGKCYRDWEIRRMQSLDVSG
jgi:hypothetical protein